MFNLEDVGNRVTELIKRASWFPYKGGHLKIDATSGQMLNDTTYRIHFDSDIAPYVEYLEEGTKPHDIPNAFGKGEDSGIGGRFEGKFHPGSMKHKGFISEKSVQEIIAYIVKRFEGEVEKI